MGVEPVRALASSVTARVALEAVNPRGGWGDAAPERPAETRPGKDSERRRDQRTRSRSSEVAHPILKSFVVPVGDGQLRRKLVMRAIRVIRVAVKKKKNKANVIRFLTGKKLSRREIDLAYPIVDLNINAESITSDTWIKLSTWTQEDESSENASQASPRSTVDRAFEGTSLGHKFD